MNQLQTIGTWDEAYLKTLPVGEFDWIDFKDSRWLDGQWLDEASQYLSAFANYDGGYLIIGVHDPKDGVLEPDGGIDRSIKNGLKDWLEDKLPNLVEYRLDRISVQEILGVGQGSLIKPEHCVIVIHVPPSAAAPHQARDHKYYTRLGSHLSGLGHRAIMDILNRRRHPIIKTTISLTQGLLKNHLCWHVENKSSVMARFVSTVVNFPAYIQGCYPLMQDVGTLINDKSTGKTYWKVVFHNTGDRPLFPSATLNGKYLFEFGHLPAELAERPDTLSRDVSFKTYADDMPYDAGTLRIEDITKIIG
jgi:hypothetical protein